jgi:hypothetical protein
MDKNKASMSRAQEKAKSFIDEHNVEKVISEMLNSLVHSRDPNPIIFMVSISLFFKLFRLNTSLTW